MGGQDGAYDRNVHALRWKELLAACAANDPGAYRHDVVIYPNKGHWMDGEDLAGVQWMAEHDRNLRPDRVVWLQDDVLHKRFYWLKVDRPVKGDRVVVKRQGQTITIEEGGVPKQLRIRLDDDMLDLDKSLNVVDAQGEVLFEGWVPRTSRVIEQTLGERGDPKGVFLGELIIDIP
jgi:hypothetical protein